MKFIMLIAGTDEARNATNAEAHYAEIGKWWEALAREGKIVGGDELSPAQMAKTVRKSAGKTLVADGPFAETKEILGGYAILEVADMDAEVAIASTWPNDSFTIELRPIVER